MRRTLILATVALAAAVLSGCSPAASEPSDPELSASESPSSTPSATPTAEALSIVDCETLLPIDLARTAFSDSAEFLGERSLTESSGWFELPEITAGLADASQGVLCEWGVPNSDGIFTLHVAEIDADIRADVEAALTPAGFTTVTTGTVTAYEGTAEDVISTIAATHLFTGDVWIMSNATSLSTSGAVAGSALDALRVANPTLGL